MKKNREYVLIVGSIGLILTHSVIAMYTAILCFIYLLTQIKKIVNKQIITKLIVSLVFIVLITSFFWAPLLEHKFSANYEVFKPGRMERTEVLIALKLSFLNMFYEIGIVHIVLLCLSAIAIKKIFNKRNDANFINFYIFSFIIGMVCSFMTLKIFPFEKLPAILKMLQFSFRLLEFSAFFIAFVAAINIGSIIETIKYKHVILFILLLMFSMLLYIPKLHFSNNINENRLIDVVPVTAKTGRVHAGCASFEYLPCKAFENRSYIENRTKDVIIIKGNATIENAIKNETNMSFEISNIENEVELELPYIYYLGYEAVLENNNEKVKLETFETDNGFVGIKISNFENGNVKIKYKGTNIMIISSLVSYISCIVLGFVVIKHLKKKFD